MSDVPVAIDPPTPRLVGLRERKKAQTRKMLIDTAVDMCLRQGYELTTVEQIADAVAVSPRTFSRYFGSKEAVFVAVIDDFATEIVDELNAQPLNVGPMEALRAAHMSVLARVSERGQSVGLSAERIQLILRVVYSSDALRQKTMEYRSAAAMEALSRHMGVSPDDRRLELAVALFVTTIVTACEDEVANDLGFPRGPDFIMDRLEKALVEVAQFTAQLKRP